MIPSACSLITRNLAFVHLQCVRTPFRLSGWKTDDGGFNGIYCDLAGLELTRRLIVNNPQWRIPEMNRSLVEGATHPDCTAALIAEKGDAWDRYDRLNGGARAAEGMVARLNVLDRAEPFDDSLRFPPSDERIMTGRLRRRACTSPLDRRGIRAGCPWSVSTARSSTKDRRKPVCIFQAGSGRAAGGSRNSSLAGSSERAETRRTGEQIHAWCLAHRATVGIRSAYSPHPTAAMRSGDRIGQDFERTGSGRVLAGGTTPTPRGTGRNGRSKSNP